MAVLLAIALAFQIAAADGPATLRNDDTCDIGVTPAATLLLPYFEVDLENAAGETTLITITNVTDVERVARVTLWTDLSYPVLTFNLYLTGYDVQSLNLRDVLTGAIAPPLGTGASVSPAGGRSGRNYRLDDPNCALVAPGLDALTVSRMQEAFTLGSIAGVCDKLGTVHVNAVGYATIDVVGNCDTNGPADPEYFTRDIRYDNVLLGDYLQIAPAENFAQGNPMVHIRAMPHGRTPQTRTPLTTRFDRTFYGRFQPPDRPLLDARQPLPSTFAARWINGGGGQFQTSLKIWRQGATTASADCSAYRDNELLVAESVVFDDHENGEGIEPDVSCGFPICVQDPPVRLPSTALVTVEYDEAFFRQVIVSSTVSGWIYLNLDDDPWDDSEGDTAHQSWVVVSMRAESRYSVDFDAAWLGNGCSPPALLTSYTDIYLPPVGNGTTPTGPGAVLPGPANDVNPR